MTRLTSSSAGNLRAAALASCDGLPAAVPTGRAAGNPTGDSEGRTLREGGGSAMRHVSRGSDRPMPAVSMNELTFAGWLAEFTAVRAAAREAAGESTLIAVAAIEERQVDEKGVVRRCDIRFNTARGRKLASGELKRPEVAEGRDVRGEALRADARRKALARGLPYYFTCNMSHVALYEMASSPKEDDQEIDFVELAPINNSGQAVPYREQMRVRWAEFLDGLEERLAAVGRTRPSVTSADVIALRDAIFAISNEASGRVARRLAADPALTDEVRAEAAKSSISQPLSTLDFRPGSPRSWPKSYASARSWWLKS